MHMSILLGGAWAQAKGSPIYALLVLVALKTADRPGPAPAGTTKIPAEVTCRRKPIRTEKCEADYAQKN